MEIFIVPGLICVVVIVLAIALVGKANRNNAGGKKAKQAPAAQQVARPLTPAEIEREELVSRAVKRTGERFDAKYDAEMDAKLDALNAPVK